MTLVAVLVFAIASGVYPRWTLARAAGAGGDPRRARPRARRCCCRALFVRYRDIAPIWEVFSQALFYASPILYVTTMVPESFQHAYCRGPIAAILTQMRHAIDRPDRARPPPRPSAAPSGC